MSNPRSDFFHSSLAEPHRARTREILARHPELRALIGRNPATFAWLVLIVASQFTIAWLLRDQPWWAVIAIAWLVGAFHIHALFVIIHECTHNLVFEGSTANALAGLAANLPSIVPSAASFRKYHIKHHSFQGVYELDADLPERWEARVVGNTWFGKAMWLLLFPVFQTARTSRLRELPLFDRWSITNVLVQAVVGVAVVLTLGWTSFAYLLLSLSFAIGLHPLGARWIQRHFVTDEATVQETYSYYGVLNRVAFNVGYHNEHHDFPSVPWNRLPEIRRQVPEVYDKLASHQSWTRLLIQWLFDPKLSLFSRVIRADRGQVPLSDVSRPDADLIARADAPGSR